MKLDPAIELQVAQKRENAAKRDFYFRVGMGAVFSIALLAITAVICYRLGCADLSKLQFPNFDFSQLLSLLLALFAVYLSALFYFKASQTSSAFYESTYDFMKDVAVLLGRMEERFVERLQSIEKGQTRMAEAMESKGDVRPQTATGSDVTREPNGGQGK